MTAEIAGKKFGSSTATPAGDMRTVLERLRDLESQVAHFMEPDVKAAIGERLKRARERSPYKQRELAAAANVSVRAYQFWEQGRSIDRSGIALVAKKLGVPFSDLWEGSDYEPQLDRIERKIDAILAVIEAVVPTQLDDAERVLALLREAEAGSRDGKSRDSTQQRRRAAGDQGP